MARGPRVAKRDLNREFERLLALVCGAIAEFSLYDTAKIAVSISRSRRTGRAGTLAYVVPLRYVGGTKERKGRRWGISGFYSYESPQVEREQPGALYIMTFLVPKFFSLKPHDRLETIVHELYHLHPQMRGDLRRFAAPHLHHGPTPAQYNRKVKALCAELLQVLPTIEAHPLLCADETEVVAFKSKRFNIPKHVFKAKPFSLFVGAALLLASITAAHAGQVPVVIIKDGVMRVAPVATAGTEMVIKRGDDFEALKLSADRKWVWVGNKYVKGWVHRDHIQSENLDKRLGIRGAYVDTKVPNKLGENKQSDREVIEKDRPLQARVAPTPSQAGEPSEAKSPTDELDELTDSFEDLQAEAEAPDESSGDALAIVPDAGNSGATGVLDLRGDLEEDPSAEQLKDLALSPEEKSHIEEGERVSKAQLRAQSRLSPIKKNKFDFKNESEATNNSENGVVTWEDTYDIDRDRANVTSPGKLFERADETAKRYGILENGDDVLPLAHTEDGKWMRVRLQETGEEGWYPASSVRVSQADRQITEVFQNSLEGHGNWGSRGNGLGYGGAYFFSFGHDESNRSWSLGFDYTQWIGQKLTFAGKSYASQYKAFQAIGRYNIPSRVSNFGVSVEAGLGYYQALILTGGITDDVLIENGLTTAAASGVAPMVGVNVSYGLAKRLDGFVMLRIFISSNATVDTGVGLRGKF